MIRINLLPHREEKRKQKKAAFIALLALGGLLGVAIVLVVGGYNATRVSVHEERNRVIKEANAELDKKIVTIANIKQEIEGLKARQQAVEDLQGDRNQPVLLLDELVRQTPDGVYLKSFKQDGQRVLMTGYAQSQERVAELLRNLAGNSQWLEKPELGEVKAADLPNSKATRRVVEFAMTVSVKRPRDVDAAAAAAAAAAGKPGAAATGAAAVPAPAASVPASAPK